PGGAPRVDGAEDALPFRGDAKADPSPVLVRGLADDHPGGLETPHVLRHSRRRHPLERRELANADSRPALDREEKRGLATGDAERMNLPPQMTIELQENRPEPVRDGDGIGGCC